MEIKIKIKIKIKITVVCFSWIALFENVASS